MPEDRFKRYQDVGTDFLESARARAEEFLRELAKATETTQRQASGQVDELVAAGRRGTDQLLDVIRREVSTQLSQLGLATQKDLDALEQRLTGQSATKKAAPPKKAATKKAASAKKTTAKKSAAKKAPAKEVASQSPTAKAPAEKEVAKKAAADRETVEKAPAQKGAAKKAPLEKAVAPRKSPAKKAAGGTNNS